MTDLPRDDQQTQKRVPAKQALREIDRLLESPRWYEGEEAVEGLLEQLGQIVQRTLNDENWSNRPLETPR